MRLRALCEDPDRSGIALDSDMRQSLKRLLADIRASSSLDELLRLGLFEVSHVDENTLRLTSERGLSLLASPVPLVSLDLYANRSEEKNKLVSRLKVLDLESASD